jgi:hypothetical protein
MQLSAWGGLDAMGGPEGLRAIGQCDGFEWFFGPVLGGEGDMVFRVPVLREDHGFEPGREVVDERDYCLAMLDRQRAAGAEIILDIDDKQGGVSVHANNIAELRGGCRQGHE